MKYLLYLKGKTYAPKGEAWERAVVLGNLIPMTGAVYDQTVDLDAQSFEPMITFGTNPGMGVDGGRIPDPQRYSDASRNA